MRAKLTDFFVIEISEIVVGSTLPFPTYIYLTLNDRYAPFTSIDSVFDSSKVEKLTKVQRKELFVPNSFHDAFLAYLKTFAKELNLNPHSIAEEADIAIAVVQDEKLSEPAKETIMTKVGETLLENLSDGLDNWNNAEKDLFLSQINNLFDEVLRKAGLEDKFYHDVLKIKSYKPITDYSVFSALISLMVAMRQKISEPHLLAPICAAALLRDTGNFQVGEFFLGGIQDKWTDEEKDKYQSHIKFGLDLSKKFIRKFPDKVKLIIEQHHERFDGTGFPNKKWHHQICKEAQYLHLADLLCLNAKGKIDGNALSINDCIEKIHLDCNSDELRKPIDPEIVFLLRKSKEEKKVAA